MLKKITKVLTRTIIVALFGKISYARYLGVKVGKDCRIYITNFGSEPFLITIGNRVTIAAGTLIVTHNGSTWLIRDEKGRRYHYQRVMIGNNVFIGMNAIILPGIKIGNNVIIGAGAVVTKSITDGMVVAGNPAKVIGEFKNYEDKALNEFVSDSAIDKELSYKNRILKIFNESFKNEMHV